MKNLIIFIVIFVCGAVSYALLGQFLQPKTEKTNITQLPTTITQTPIQPEQTESAPPKETPTTTVDADGSETNGPFRLYTEQGVKTDATVEIVRSPEENLLQFNDVTLNYPAASFVYLADDIDATHFLNLGRATFTDAKTIYGMPLDTDLSVYHYILIYDADHQVTAFYALLE